MRTRTIIVVILSLLSANAWAREHLEILVPVEHVATDANHIYLVGRTDAPIVEISLNGRMVRGVIPRDSIFHSLVYFGYGLHELVVTPVYSDPEIGPVRSETVDILAGPEIAQKYERLFTRYSFHTEEPQEVCISCHVYNAGANPTIGEAEACYDCHRVIRDRFRSHIPNDDRACTSCHALADDLTKIPVAGYEGSNPCFTCHKDKIGEFAQDYIHGPVAGGACTICHDPHGSIYGKSLTTPVAVLCPSCHDTRWQQSLKVRHKPFEQGHCNECHDPHATNNKWVLIRESQELCISCHEKGGSLDSHRHPYNVEPRRQLASPLELTDQGRLECLSCHEAHACDTPHLLRTGKDDGCGGCHPDR